MTNSTNDPISEILTNLNTVAQAERASCTERGNWEGYNFKYKMFEEEAYQAISNLLEQETLQTELDTYVQASVPGYFYINSETAPYLTVQERIIEIERALTTNKSRQK